MSDLSSIYTIKMLNVSLHFLQFEGYNKLGKLLSLINDLSDQI